MKISKDQQQAFSDASLHRFEQSMVAHLQWVYPDEAAEMGEPQLRELIRSGVQRGKAYGIVAERDVRRWLECLVGYGRDFDRNPSYSWARAILDQADLTGAEKMQRIGNYELFALRGT